MLTLISKSLEDTAKLGQKLGQSISAYQAEHNTLPLQAILMRGELGCGKTSLTRSLVQSLPNGLLAEISSPSFTICNSYPTKPEVLHVDLYRCEHNIPTELWEALDIPNSLIVIEWADFLPSSALPQNFLDISVKICEQSRSICINAHGPKAEAFLQCLQ